MSGLMILAFAASLKSEDGVWASIVTMSKLDGSMNANAKFRWVNFCTSSCQSSFYRWEKQREPIYRGDLSLLSYDMMTWLTMIHSTQSLVNSQLGKAADLSIRKVH
jgi:hypothetical protein